MKTSYVFETFQYEPYEDRFRHRYYEYGKDEMDYCSSFCSPIVASVIIPYSLKFYIAKIMSNSPLLKGGANEDIIRV